MEELDQNVSVLSSSSDEEDSRSRTCGDRVGISGYTHSYLGEVDDINCRRILMDEGTVVMLPMFCLEGTVLFPGATLPLRIYQSRYKAALDSALQHREAPCTFGVVHMYARTDQIEEVHFARVGTTAQIRQSRNLSDGSINVVAKGCQRFEIMNAWTNADGFICAQVQIMADEGALPIPNNAFANLASVPNFQSGKERYMTSKSDTLAWVSAQRRWASDESKWFYQAQLSAWPHWVYRMFDAYNLACRAADMWNQMLKFPSIYNMVNKPDMLSYHIASKIPVQDATRQELLQIGLVPRLQREIQLLESMDHIKCKTCMTLIARRSDILAMSSEGPVDAYVNNLGIVHETLTLSKAQGLTLEGEPETRHSWFPGYSWTIAYCTECMSHMGWLFNAVKKGMHPKKFWGIRRAQLAESTS